MTGPHVLDAYLERLLPHLLELTLDSSDTLDYILGDAVRSIALDQRLDLTKSFIVLE
jgi:hypothetical protein